MILVFRTDDGRPVGEFEYFRFEQYRDRIPLHRDEVRLELRVGGRAGELIGEFHPRFTGGASSFVDFVTPIEPVTGIKPLVLVVRSAVPGPIVTVDWLSLEKATTPVQWGSVGAGPRREEEGDFIFPDPTHRPIARPGAKYPQGDSVLYRPRPPMPA